MGIVTDVILPLSLAFIMFSLGLGLSLSDFTRVFFKPRDFLIGLFFIQPNLITFNMSIYIISLLNLLIHCDQLKELKWIQGLVSPEKHGKHHKNYFGIIMDDIMAGLYSMIVVYLVSLIF